MNIERKYCLFGVVIGLVFPIIGTIAELADNDLIFSLDDLIKVHASSTLLIIIDLAPIILGLAGWWIGKQQLILINLSNDLKRANKTQFLTIDGLELDLEKKNKDLNDITYATAHDLRSTLRGIASLISILQNPDEVNSLSTDEIYKKLNGRTLRMEKLLESLMFYVRTTQKENKIVQVDIVDAFTEVMQFCGLRKESYSIIAESPLISFDEEKFKYVLMALIGNAVKFNPGINLKVEVVAKNFGPYTEISVSDNGIGISKEYREKVFNLFTTLDSRDNFESVGMGLALSKRVVNDLGGEIDLNESDLGGTKVILKLKNM